MSQCRPCQTEDCEAESDYAVYSLASSGSSPAASENCRPCSTIECDDLDDYRTYSLQSDLYNVVVPFNAFNPGAQIRLRCCDGSDIVRTVTQGMTMSQFMSLLSGMVAECNLRYPGCSGTNDPVRLYSSASVGCTVVCSDGSPFTYTLPAGLFVGFSQAEADSAATVFACEQARLWQICFLGSFPSAICVGTAVNVRITAGGAVPYSGNYWQITSGTLPTGVTMTGAKTSALFSGTLTTPGSFTFTLRFVGLLGTWMTKTYTVRVLEISPSTLPDPENGVAYSQQMTLIGSAGTVTWGIASGSLPPGLSLSESGLISGIPAMTGFSTFTLRATET